VLAWTSAARRSVAWGASASLGEVESLAASARWRALSALRRARFLSEGVLAWSNAGRPIAAWTASASLGEVECLAASAGWRGLAALGRAAFLSEGALACPGSGLYTAVEPEPLEQQQG